MDPRLFTAPQYNTWIELMYDQEQEAILRYARALIKEGYPPGVLMIDEGWANYYGDWDFHPVRFPDPRGMISELHRLGFQVMLWIVPFVVPDSAVFRELRHTGVFLRDAAGKVAVREWWNGHSAVVDATGEEGARWLRKMLDALRRKYGIDGFKFDGGDISSYRDDDRAAAPASANAQAEAYGRLGTRYRLNEYRAAWKCGGLPLTQRLRDKNHSWGPDGLGSLVPNTLAQGLLGHPFVCPDMIGGGEYLNFRAQSSHLDSELFVRYAQASALMPMMQFSAAPWRVLDRRHAVLCLEAAHLHLRFGKQILAEARRSARSGEPMARSMEYQFSGAGYEHVSDQFLLGGRLLVAPVLKKGAKRRAIEIPPGTWIDDRGESFRGPIRIETDTPLERLPYFVRLSIR
ncbi:MAG TPA: glycoside hydrolase family 31 protein [Candidatus Methylacidiphilales bacterium]